MRLTTIGVPGFQHDGFSVGDGWSKFDYAVADTKAQAAFRAHVGRFVRIHPDDVGELAPLGLVLKNGRVVETKPKANPK